MKPAAIDPVCGMTVAADKGFASDYRGTHYLFCSGKCKAKFDAEPERTARRINPDGSEDDVPIAHVHVGDLPRVRPGERCRSTA